MPQQPQQPFMREKTLWIVISLLALVLLLVVFGQIQHEREFKQLSQRLPLAPMDRDLPPAVMPPPVATDTQPMGSTPATTTAPQASSSTMPLVSEERTVLGSIISPDGKWRLDLEKEEAPLNGIVTVSHVVILHGLQGQADVTVLTAREFIKDTFEAVPGKTLATNWEAAGWSQDGTKVYYVSTPYMEGLGGFYPDGLDAKGKLYEINLNTKEMTKRFDHPMLPTMNGIRDVLPTKNLVLYSAVDQKLQRVVLFASDLDGKNLKQIYVAPKNREISGAIFNADGTRVLIVTNHGAGEGNDMYYEYGVAAYDLTASKLLPIVDSSAPKAPKGFSDPKWDTLRHVTFHNTGEKPATYSYDIP